MKLYAPSYYKKFKCIADKCEHSCCIGWEIDIDEVTLKKYEKLKNGYAPAIKESISLKETPHFKLCEGDRCPHLDETGLCKIISRVGEDYLCDICREHPRFYNFTSVAEVGIGMSCTEAARIILSSPEYDSIEKIGKVDAIKTGASFDGRAERGKLYSILKEHSDPYGKRLDEIRKSYLIPSREDIYYLKIIDSLEYLDESHKTLFMNYSSNCRPEGKDGYELYLGGSHAVLTIENPEAEGELVVFCDSFGQSMAPLLAQGFGKTTLVDIRYIQSAMVGAFADFEHADILFLYSTSMLNNSTAMK